MKNLKIKVILPILCVLLTSCGGSGGSNSEGGNSSNNSKYTITWKNNHGTVLKTDKIRSGETPSYSGDTPTPEWEKNTDCVTYKFDGWTPEIIPAVSNATYTAKYLKLDHNVRVFSPDSSRGTVSGYGYYEKDTTVTVTAQENEGFLFDAWYEVYDYDKKTFINIVDTNKNHTFKVYDEEVVLYARFITKAEQGDEKWQKEHGVIPQKESDYVTYGYYPQKLLTDEAIIAELKNAENLSGYKVLNDKYYKSIKIGQYNVTYDGVTYKAETTYYFEAQPVKWKILDKSGSKYTLISTIVFPGLDYSRWTGYGTKFDYEGNQKDVYANNYAFSELRTYLNVDLYKELFVLGTKYLKKTEVDNSIESTKCEMTSEGPENKYVCNNTNDYLFAPSYAELTNSDYGFGKATDADSNRIIKQNAYSYLTSPANACFYTRSPSYSDKNKVWTVTPNGKVSEASVSTAYGVVPCITINF